MYTISEIYYFITHDIRTTIISILIGVIAYSLAKLYLRVIKFPPGPLPIPVIGNVLLFRGINYHWSYELNKISKKYGPVFTIWMGPNPFVIISDIDIAREAFRKIDFAGRPDSYFAQQLSNEKYRDVAFTDYGRTWEALRRVTHSAVNKYTTNPKLSLLVSDVMEETVKLIIQKEGTDNYFQPFNYIYSIFLNILASSVFGKRFSIDDNEYKYLKYATCDFYKEVGSRLMLWEFSKLFRVIDRALVAKGEKLTQETVNMLKVMYVNHYKDYDENNIRDFCDALISAKNDAINEGKDSAPYLIDQNLAASVLDIFIAGIDTSYNTFRWLLLLLAYFPNIQKKLRQEIEAQIADRIPEQKDIKSCDYVMAFISETLRFRNTISLGLFHKAMVTSKIGKYTIPKETGIIVYQDSILRDEKYWQNPEQFIPERFIENGKYLTTRPLAFIPFGVERRVCLGEKMAIADLFMVLVRLLQLTKNYEILIQNDCDLEPDPNSTNGFMTKDYKICLKSI